jgi:hypothetical protein
MRLEDDFIEMLNAVAVGAIFIATVAVIVGSKQTAPLISGVGELLTGLIKIIDSPLQGGKTQ